MPSSATRPLRLRIPQLDPMGLKDLPWTDRLRNQNLFAQLASHMGDKPAHFPETTVKAAYDANSFYLTFRVEDRYIKATARHHQDSVCQDSCVEFFFTPGTDINSGYFNLEINCGGTLLIHFQKGRELDQKIVAPEDCSQIDIKSTLPKIIDPEIKDSVTWTVSCRLPFFVLEKYCPFEIPSPGAVWRANFYKCADKTSHPHWLTWSAVPLTRPDFHQPRYFGVLEFD